MIKIVIVVLFFCEMIFTQNLHIEKISIKDGLSNSYINCLLQDKVGFIWIGTDDGLNRFDGYEIKVYRNNVNDKNSISENIIWALCEDHTGNLWIGTKTGGLNRYNPKTEKFENWKLSTSDVEEINITYIYEDSKHNIWIGTYRNGLYRFNPKKKSFDHWQNTTGKQKIIADNFVTSVLEDQFSNIWIGTYNGLNLYTPNDLEYPFKEVVKNIRVPVWYLSSSSFFKNNIWISTLNGLLRYDLTSQKLIALDLPNVPGSLYGNSVSTIVEEKYLDEKILWIGTYDGLVRINLTTDYKERIVEGKNTGFKILSNEIHDVIIDKSGVIWIATDNGLNFYSSKRSKFNYKSSTYRKILENPELFDISIRAITQSKNGSLWFGSETGLIEMRKKNDYLEIVKNPELNSLNVWSLASNGSDKLWIGTYGQGLKEYDLRKHKLKTWKTVNVEFNSTAFSYIRTLLEDDDGKVWIGFWGGGLARLNPENSKIEFWRNEKNDYNSLSYNDVWDISIDRKGRIWVATNGGGLNLYQGEVKNNFYNWKSSKRGKQKLSSNNIYTLCESINANNNENETILWIGTSNGLNKFIIRNDKGSTDVNLLNTEVKYYTVEDGLPDNSVESILEDANGNLWLGTSAGISFFNIKNEEFINFTIEDGLIGSSFNTSAAFRDNDGMMLFGCANGINFFNPDRIVQSKFSPKVIISDIQILNQAKENDTIPQFKSNHIENEIITLSHEQNDLSIQFTSLDFNAPEKNEYAYYLYGFDRDWIFSGSRRFVTYTNLDPGEYELLVKGTNSDGIWSKQIARVTILIRPPYWKTWWAYTIYMVVFVGMLSLIRDVEVKKRKRKEEERLRIEREEALLREAELKAKNAEQEKEIEKQKIRNRIAQDLHDEIGSNLSSISLMTEIIQKDYKTGDEFSEKIKRIHKVAKGSTQAIRDIVWLTNPSSDSISDLITKMNEVAENILGKFKLNFSYPSQMSELILQPELKRNLFFIYKETLNNIVLHSEATYININFELKDNLIRLAIRDNGKGFNIANEYKGNGLKNIKSRTNEIGAKLNFESKIGIGTLLELVVNYTQVRD